jgi:uncharacterized membrane protein
MSSRANGPVAASSPPKPPIVCPVCHGENPPEAVFCGNPACCKALGEFRYVREELLAASAWYERIADRVAGFVGRPQFLAVHVLWFLFWVAVNTGAFAVVARFDDYPFGLLGIILSVEAIFITGFLLISQNRQGAHADKRAELDYEVNVRTYREIHEIDFMLRAILARLDRLEGAAQT